MLQLRNCTPFAATLAVFPDPAGVECVYAAVKASFDLSHGGPVLAPKPVRFLAADVFWGDPAKSSLRAAADITLCKPATDVCLVGRAVAPGAVPEMDVHLRVGPVRKTVRVFGDRHWVRFGDAWAISVPQTFERMPLRWEFAFGGIGAAAPGQPTEFEPRNPVGMGFVASYTRDLQDHPLPNLEDPAQLLGTPMDRPPPACFAPLAPVWMPRRAYAGTYDAAWQSSRAPFLPADFDARYFQVASPDLVAPGYLVGGEPVEVVGCTAGNPLQFTLPNVQLGLQWDVDGRLIDGAAQLDTVLIEPDLARLQMVWRALLPMDKRLLHLRQVTLRSAQYSVDRVAA